MSKELKIIDNIKSDVGCCVFGGLLGILFIAKIMSELTQCHI